MPAKKRKLEISELRIKGKGIFQVKNVNVAVLCKLIESEVKDEGFDIPYPEYKFNTFRKFRFDFAWPNYKFALEIEGGTKSKTGGHRAFNRYHSDLEKYNLAAEEGWIIYRVLTEEINKGNIRNLVKALENARDRPICLNQQNGEKKAIKIIEGWLKEPSDQSKENFENLNLTRTEM